MIETRSETQSKSQRDKQNEFQENFLMWVIRYVMIPIVLASIAGFFALAVVDRSFQHENGRSNDDPLTGIFATMTAAAVEAQPTPSLRPTATVTAVPSATDEAGSNGTGIVNKPVPPVTDPPGVCPQVPYGWQLYTVQPGNTLYSLARETGTTVETIRQVNCLYGELLAYSQIWLPGGFMGRQDPGVEITRIVEPIETITPTVTVTEPPPLPDITIGSISTSSPVFCTKYCPPPAIQYTVNNVGVAYADPFTINIQLAFNGDPFAEQDVIVGGLAPNEAQTLVFSDGSLDTCNYQGCQICIKGDSDNEVTENNEDNNKACLTVVGQGAAQESEE